jgi:hypothetical protein
VAYSLRDALASIAQYSEYDLYQVAVTRLQVVAENNPRGLRAEASRLREAFYIYDQGFTYAKA